LLHISIINNIDVIKMDEDLLIYWIPFILTVLVVRIALYPELKLLMYNGKKFAYLYFVLTILFISVPFIILQSYISTSNDTYIANISDSIQLKENISHKFFRFKNMTVITNNYKEHLNVRFTGRFGNVLNISIYFMFPILLNGEKLVGCWYGVALHDSHQLVLKNKSNEYIKQTYFKFKEKIREFNFYNYNYLEKIGYSKTRNNFIKALNNNNLENTVIFVPRMESLYERNNKKRTALLVILIQGTFLYFFLLLISKYEYKNRLKKHDDYFLKIKEYIVIIKYLPFVNSFTIRIVISLILLFFIQSIKFGSFFDFNIEQLYKWGGLSYASIVNYEYWRLISYMFIHANLMHLIQNIIILTFFGLLLENFISNINLLFIYSVSGILSGLFTVLHNKNVFLMGASGAIFGVVGALAYISFLRQDAKFIKNILIPFFIINFSLSLFTPSISFYTHILGFLIGGILELFVILTGYDQKTISRIKRF